MKKVLSLVLVISLVLGSFAPVFAAADENDYANQAELLKSLGVLKGDENGNLDLNATLDRQTLMVLTARLMGEEQVAENFKFESPFSDVDHPYFESFISWAYNKGLTNGYGDGTFGPTDLVTVEQLQIFMLRALGYDPQWGVDNIPEMAIEAGIMGDVEAEGNASRGIMAAIVYNTLEADMADGSGTLAASLNVDMPKTAVSVAAVELGTVENGADLELPETVEVTFDNGTTEELAVDWADYDTTVGGDLTIEGTVEGIELTALATAVVEEADLTVASVEAINLKQIEVVFNKTVDADSAADEDNYSLSDGEVIDAQLLEDDKTVVLTLDVARDQQEEIDITVEDVEDVNENSIEEVTIEEVEFVDITMPEVVDAEVVGNDTIKVYFSEPMKVSDVDDDVRYFDKDWFEVEDGDMLIKEVRATNNDTEALVEVFAELEDGNTSITVDNDIEDYAGFGVKTTTLDVDVNEDEEGPKVVGYEDAELNGVTLIFDEDIELTDDADEEFFYHTNDEYVNVDGYTIDGNKLILDFTDNTLPEGIAYVYLAEDAVSDLWDNDNAKQVIKIEVEVDEIAPSFESLDVSYDEDDNEYTIEIEFDDDLGDIDEDNFMLYDEDGDEVEDVIDDDNMTVSGDTVTFVTSEELSGDYVLEMEDIEDDSDNVMDDFVVEFNVDDLERPDFDEFTLKLYDASDDGQMLRIDFDEKMASEGKYSVLDLEKYAVVDGSDTYILSEIDGVEIDLVDNGEVIEIEIPSLEDLDDDEQDDAVEGEDYLDMTASMDVTIARVADKAGNYTVALSRTKDVSAAGAGVDFVEIDNVEATDVDTIEVTFSDYLTDLESDDLALTLSVSDAVYAPTISRVKTSIDDDGNTVVTFTLDDDTVLNYDGTYTDTDNGVVAEDVSVIVVASKDTDDDDVLDAVQSNNEFGETLNIGDEVVADDGITPVLAEDEDVDEDDVDDVKVSEVMTDASADWGNDFDGSDEDGYVVVTLTFEEAMKDGTVSLVSFEVDGYTVLAVDVDGDEVKLLVEVELDGNEYDAPEAGTNVTQEAPIKDASGNVVDDIDTEIGEF